jgi:hypothetical protein
MIEATHGSVLSQLTLDGLKNITLPLPSLEEQQRIVDRVAEALNRAGEAQRLIDEYMVILAKAQSSVTEVLNSLHLGGGMS